MAKFKSWLFWPLLVKAWTKSAWTSLKTYANLTLSKSLFKMKVLRWDLFCSSSGIEWSFPELIRRTHSLFLTFDESDGHSWSMMIWLKIVNKQLISFNKTIFPWNQSLRPNTIIFPWNYFQMRISFFVKSTWQFFREINSFDLPQCGKTRNSLPHSVEITEIYCHASLTKLSWK